ncbi:MAG: CPBP family intramembrane metalloprotease [Candidatus Hydrogenedens sp.]|nr:CPBP family intramembrane metalloprotease [Candidatus Hydrogenedens sp.]
MTPERLESAFLVLFALYLAQTVAAHYRNRKSDQPHPPTLFRALMQSPLVILSFVLAWHYHALDRGVFSLPMIVAGLLVGHVIFAISVYATHRDWDDALAVFLDWESLRDYFVNNPNVSFRIVNLSLTEELIYRVVLQHLTITHLGFWPGLLLTALLFGLSHEHLFRNHTRETAEFLVFSVLLGAVYYATGSLVLVVAIHAVRNFEIAIIDFNGRAHDLGSEAEAQRELDRAYRQTSPEPE